MPGAQICSCVAPGAALPGSLSLGTGVAVGYRVCSQGVGFKRSRAGEVQFNWRGRPRRVAYRRNPVQARGVQPCCRALTCFLNFCCVLRRGLR